MDIQSQEEPIEMEKDPQRIVFDVYARSSPVYDVPRLFRALHFVSDIRRNQQNSAYYINHVIRMIDSLASVNVNDEDVLVAAMLYNIIKDTETTHEEIIRYFGNRALDITVECSDDPSLDNVQNKVRHLERARDFSRGAKMVTMALLLSILTGLRFSPPPDRSDDEKNGYTLWCSMMVDQMRGTNALLEKGLDLFFTDGAWTNPSVTEQEKQDYLAHYYESFKI